MGSTKMFITKCWLIFTCWKKSQDSLPFLPLDLTLIRIVVRQRTLFSSGAKLKCKVVLVCHLSVFCIHKEESIMQEGNCWVCCFSGNSSFTTQRARIFSIVGFFSSLSFRMRKKRGTVFFKGSIAF